MVMKKLSQTRRIFSAIFVLVIFSSIFFITKVQAADLVNRSIRLSASWPSANVNHRFTFTTVTPGNVGSVQFLYCSNSPLEVDPCTAPAGLNVAGAGIASQSGLAGFSVSGASTANNLILTRTPSMSAPVSADFNFSNIINPSTSNEVDYVRITVFDGINGTGAVIDSGSVVFVVDDWFSINAYVPPYMTFCVGVSVALNCSTTAGFLSDFGEFSEFGPSTVTSQFAVATNDVAGYNVFVAGQTMTSGNNIINPLLVQTTSNAGQSQFGINLRNNSSPSVGANVEGAGSGTPAPNYNTPNQFRFVSGERVAGSNLTTDFNRYTVSYLVNIDDEQNPGIYATTMTYTAIASF